jgi:hypothetical protein
MVHPITAAPTDAAMTMRTVIAVADMPEEDEGELVCVGVGVLLEVRYTTDWVPVAAGVLVAWADVSGVLDEWLDVEDAVLDTADDVVVDRSPPTTELNKSLVEGLADGETDATTEVVWTDTEFTDDVWATAEVPWVGKVAGDAKVSAGVRFFTRRPRSAWSRRWRPKVLEEAATAKTREKLRRRINLNIAIWNG